MRTRILFFVGLSVALNSGVLANQTIIAYGDSRTNPDQHLQVVTAFAKFNPNAILHTGDLWDDYTSAEWLGHLTGRPAVKKVLDDSLFLVARGNHETEAEVLALRPKIVRNGSINYSVVRDSVFFLSLGYGPASTNLAYARQQLSSIAAKAADWRIVFFHAPIYSTGEHGGSGNATMINLCDSFKVNAVFSGHDHIYERSKLMYKGQSRSTSTSITDSLGTFYTVIGVGGAPFYDVAGDTRTGFKMANKLAFCVIKTTPTSMRIEARGIDTLLIDAVTWTKPTTGVASRSTVVSAQPSGTSALYVKSQRSVTVNNVPFTGPVTVELYSLDGKMVSTKSFTQTSPSLSIPDINPAQGVHAVCVRSEKAWLWTPLVVQ